MIRRFKENEIDEIAQILKRNGVISVPTDTVYGLCARINSIEAYNNLISIKNRPNTKPFPIMCSNIEQIKNISLLNEKAEKLINNFMPGPITLVLKKQSKLPTYITNGKNTIAIRMATSKVLENLIEKVGSPIFMSSANKSGEKVCTNLEEIENSFPNLDGILEGIVSFNQASTIVDCTSDELKILREGPISFEQIMKCINFYE